jgi:hypothetical protein
MEVAMATIVLQVVDKIWCDRVRQEAELLEERVYPADAVPDVGAPFKVRARRCAFGTECNLAGCACRWSYLNPNYDPFAEIGSSITNFAP